MKERKLRMLHITPDAILSVLRKGEMCHIVTEGLPPDADFRECHYDHETGTFFIAIWSESYSPVPEGSVIPPCQKITICVPPPCKGVDACTAGMEIKKGNGAS